MTRGALQLAVIECGMRKLEASGTPDPAAPELLRLAQRVELDTGRTSGAIPWLLTYLSDCHAGAGCC